MKQSNTIKKNKDKLLNIFKLVFKLKKKDEIINYTSKNNIKWDSLNHIKLIIYIEKNFNIKFGLKQFNKANSYKKILNYINKKK